MQKLTQGLKGFKEIFNHTHPLLLGVDVKDLWSATLPPTEDGFVAVVAVFAVVAGV